MSRPYFFQRILRRAAEHRWLPDGRLLEFYPPFLAMRIKVLEVSPQWRKVRIRLPLNTISRNPGGVMFGGFQLMHKYTLFVRNAATAASDNSEHHDKQHYPDKSWDKVEDACPPVKLSLL
jgi:hypothetical protein